MTRANLPRRILSDEQQAVVECPARTVLVSAGAGTGKTSTLEEYAAARSHARVLYLAFNQAIRTEASRRFPRNVRCLTTHGMAFPHFGRQFERKLGNAKPYHLSAAFGIPMVTAGVALEGVLRWLSSADVAIDEIHFADADVNERGKLVDIARKAWQVMCDPAASGIPMPHDGYLKLYQLSRPELDYDVILFDEAQDANPAVLDVINRQERSTRVFVGDRRQAIYGFRGAVNAMDNAAAEAHLQLTGSFRYAQGVADIANSVLSAYAPQQLKLRGLAHGRTRFNLDPNAPHTLLARTNAGLFSAAVDVMESGRPFSFVGGAGSYRFTSLLDADKLRRGQGASIRDPFLRAFDSYDDLRAYAESVEDGELHSLMSIVDRYRDDLPSLVESLTASSAQDKKSGSAVTLGTAHRAKGLEWSAVSLHDDFTDMRTAAVEGGPPVIPDEEEINLLYVAITRAREAIVLHDPLLSWMNEADPTLHAKVTLDLQRPNLPAKTVSGMDFAQPTFPAGAILDDVKLRGFLRDAPAMIASAVGKSDPSVHHLMKLLFDMTFHLATGDVVLSPPAQPSGKRPGESATQTDVPVPATRQRKPRGKPVAVIEADPCVVMPLWMTGKSLESISEHSGVPVDAVIAAVTRTLSLDREAVKKQNEKRII